MKGVVSRKLLVALIALLIVALSCALLVSCKTSVYSVTAEFDAGGGTVEVKDADGNVAAQFAEGATATVTVTPKQGFEITAFKVNGVDKQLVNGVYSHTVTEDTVFSVTFTEKTAPAPIALTAPVIAKDGNKVTWSAVEHATGYEVYLNGTKKADVTACEYTFAETAVGTYKLTVKAISADSSYTASAFSNEVSFAVEAQSAALAAPVIVKNGNKVTWTAVEHATGYEVYLNGTKKIDVTVCEYTFAETVAGTYNVTVKAVSADSSYTASVASNSVQFVVENPIDVLAAALQSVKTTFRAEGEATYTETGSTAQLNNIIVVFGDGVKSTLETTLTGEVTFEQAVVNRDGKAALPYHTKNNTVEYQLSKEDYAVYDNPFKTLTVADFEVTAVNNVFRLKDAAKAKAAASNITGWEEAIDSFLVTVADGKIVKIDIETAQMPIAGSDTDVKESIYTFTVSQHGVAVVDPEYTSPYERTADHDRLAAALTNAKAADNYTWRVHEQETGYEDLDYNIYVTDGMIYIDCEGWESGYWLTNDTVYPFDYVPATDKKGALLTLLDPLTDKTFATVRALFIDSAFLPELFKCVNNNTFVLRDSQHAGDLAFYFADGRDNQKLYLGYTLDLTVTLSAEGKLNTVEFSYYVYGALVKRTLTFTDVNNTTIDIDTTNIEYSSVLDDYIGQYVSADKQHTVEISDEGILVDGEQFVIEMYSAANGTFVGTINGETYYILNMFQKQLVIYNETDNDEDRVQFVVTDVNIGVVDIPERYKGLWATTVGDDKKLLTVEVLDNTVIMDGLELTVLSYDDYNEVIAMDTDGWTYALWLDIDGLAQDQMYFVIFVNGSRLGGFTLNRIYNIGEDELPDDITGVFEGVDEDGTEYELKITDKYIIVNAVDGEFKLNMALVVNSVEETEDGKKVVLLYSASNNLTLAVVLNGDGTYSLCEADSDGNLTLWAVLEPVDPNAVKIPETLQGTFEGTASDGTKIKAEITSRNVTLLFDGAEQNVVIKGLEERESWSGTYIVLIVTVDGVDYELAEYTDKSITIETNGWRVPVELTKVTATEPDPTPGEVIIPDELIGTFEGTANDKTTTYKFVITKDSVVVYINGVEVNIVSVAVDGSELSVSLDDDTLYVTSMGDNAIFICNEDYSVMATLNRIEGGEEPTIPSKYYGTFQGTSDDGTKYVMVIDASGVYVTIGNGAEIQATVTEYEVNENAYELITLTVGNDEVNIMIFNGDGINDDFDVIKGFNYSVSGKDVDVNLTRTEGGDTPVTPSIEIPEDFIGTFKGTSAETGIRYELIITDKTISLLVKYGDNSNAFTCEATKLEEGKYGDQNLTIVAENQEYVIQIYYGALSLSSSNEDGITLIKYVDNTVVPDELIGEFSGKNDAGEEYILVITANEATVIIKDAEGNAAEADVLIANIDDGWGLTLYLAVNEVECTFLYDDYDKCYVLASAYDYGVEINVKLYPVSGSIDIPEEFQGVFKGTDSKTGIRYELTLTDKQIDLMIVNETEVSNFTGVATKLEEGDYVNKLSITVNGQDYIIQDYEGSYNLSNDSGLYLDLVQYVDGVIIAEEFRGSFIGENSVGEQYQLEITETTATLIVIGTDGQSTEASVVVVNCTEGYYSTLFLAIDDVEYSFYSMGDSFALDAVYDTSISITLNRVEQNNV